VYKRQGGNKPIIDPPPPPPPPPPVTQLVWDEGEWDNLDWQ